MTRRKQKKPKEQQKRLQKIDASGWTHIIKGSRGQNHQRHISLLENGKPTEAPENVTIDKVSEKFHRYCQMWKDSHSSKELQLILADNVLTSEKVNLTRCVCLGLGSLTSEDGREASMYELAFLHSTLEILGQKHQIADVYLQDPAFNRLDEEFIVSLGYTVVENPEAFDKVDTTTFLFVPHLEAQFYAMVLEVAHPSLCIGNDLEACGETYPGGPVWMLAARDTFSRYLETTISKPMPLFERDTWPYFMRVYWPRSNDNPTGKEALKQDNYDGIEIAERLDGLRLEESKEKDFA